MPEFFIQSILLSLLLGLHFLLALGGLGTICMAAMVETFSGAGKKAFLNKLSDQSGKLGAMLLLYLGLALAGSFWVWMLLYPEQFRLWMVDKYLLPVALGVPGLAVILGVFYKWLQKSLSNSRGAHAALGVLASISALAALLLAAMSKQHLLLLADKDATYPTLEGLARIQLADPETWGYFALLSTVALASGGALSQLFLLIRRNRDDYGRDYYAYAARTTCRWTWIFALLALAPWGYFASVMMPSLKIMPQSEATMGFFFAYPVFMAVAVALFFAVGRSAMPMRHKPAMICGAASIWLALASFTAFLNQVYWIFPKLGIFGA